jgi:hypothetical protein
VGRVEAIGVWIRYGSVRGGVGAPSVT